MSSGWLILSPVALQSVGEAERDGELFPYAGSHWDGRIFLPSANKSTHHLVCG